MIPTDSFDFKGTPKKQTLRIPMNSEKFIISLINPYEFTWIRMKS